LYWFDRSITAETDAEKWVVIGSDHVAKADADGSGNNIVSTYQTKTQAASDYNALVGMIGNVNSFDVTIIADIANAPQPGDTGFSAHTIYFVLNNAISTDPDDNKYDEYLWITTDSTTTPITGHYEKIGTTETDLNNYYTKTAADDLYGEIWDAIGITAAESTAQDYVSIDDRIEALETDTTDSTAISEINAKLGTWADSTAQGFVSVRG
jgi:hypothetical protein